LFGLSTLEERPRLERLPVSLEELTKTAVNRARSSASSYGAELVLAPSSSPQSRISVHREMATRALGNLLFNAIQHGGGGKVHVALRTEGNDGIVTVSDGGLPVSTKLRVEAFTAAGQIACKSDPDGRYSRGLGLFAAGIAAALSGAEVFCRQTPEGKSLLELRATLA
jgi:K+-sensing histidine kinase KdpD